MTLQARAVFSIFEPRDDPLVRLEERVALSVTLFSVVSGLTPALSKLQMIDLERVAGCG